MKNRTDTLPADADIDTLPAAAADDTFTGAEVVNEDPTYPPAPEGIDLVVTSAFASYAVGERITDRATIAEILARTPHFVVATASLPPAETNEPV